MFHIFQLAAALKILTFTNLFGIFKHFHATCAAHNFLLDVLFIFENEILGIGIGCESSFPWYLKSFLCSQWILIGKTILVSYITTLRLVIFECVFLK